MKKLITRREFIKRSSATVLAGAAAPTVFAKNKEFGKKGQLYPDQRRKYRDSKTGHIVWQMTDTPGRVSHAQYFTQAGTTPDGKWLLYGSDRGCEKEQLNIFKMNLETGESIQITDSTKDAKPRWSHISPDGKEIYYIENMNHFKAVNIETLEERSLCVVEGCHRPHQLGVSPDNRFIVNGAFFEKKEEPDFTKSLGFLIRSALIVIDTQTGAMHKLLDGNTPRGHIQYCPSDVNLLLYSYQGPWWRVQRMWMINADGTNNRPFFIQTNFEGAGHEFWSEDGKTVYVTCSGGRQPQGLWAVDTDGSNERCVLAGACLSHGTANAAEDRFVVDDMYADCKTGMWMSKKGSIEPEFLCQTGVNWHGERQEFHPHPRFLPDGKRVAFSSAMNNTGGEVYLVEV